jgi:hypothetical protein
LGVLRREITINETAYSYSIADAGQDGGPWRTLEFRVLPLGIVASDTESTISATNAQIGPLNNVQVISDAQGALWSCSPPGDVDLVGFKVWASQTSGFPLTVSNLKYDGTSPIRQLPLEPNRTWYVRCGAYDVWGDDNMNVSGEFMVQTGAVGASHISVLSLSSIVANLGEIIAGKMRSADNTVDFDLDQKRLRVLDQSAGERVKLGLLETGKYGLRVSNPTTGKSATITSDIGIIIAQGTATMPTTLNADGSYGVQISLPATFNYADLTVIVTLEEVDRFRGISYTEYPVTGWGVDFTPVYREYVFYTAAFSGSSYFERDGLTANGLYKYKTHTVPTGKGENYVTGVVTTARWDKGTITSANYVQISGAKLASVYKRAANSHVRVIETTSPVSCSYTVIAKNYQG